MEVGASQVVLVVKKKKKTCLPMQETQEPWVRSLGREDSPGGEHGYPPHGGIHMAQKVGHNRVTNTGK